MSNTKDTPMDYKQIERDAECYVFNHIHDPFGLSKQECYVAGATSMLNENASLKSELQKQKELNAELVKGLKRASNFINNGQVKADMESLIKKSNEI